MRYEWDFKDDKDADVFVSVSDVLTNVVDLIKGQGRTRLAANLFNPGNYKICLTASVGKTIMHN